MKSVIFDMDGVLLDSIPLHKKAFEMIFRKHDMPFSMDRFPEINGKSIRDVFTYIRENYGGFDLEAAVKDKLETNMDIARQAPLFEGVMEVLEDLKDRDLMLASSASRAEIDIVLDRFHLRDIFSCSVAGDEIQRTKPHPDIFLRCPKTLGIPPDRCIVIEDAPNGIKAAIAAGMRCIAITTTHKKADLDDADAVLDDIKAIPDFLQDM